MTPYAALLGAPGSLICAISMNRRELGVVFWSAGGSSSRED
jgi:hypothetical protein